MSTAAFDLELCLEGVRSRDAQAAEALVAHLYPLVIRIVRAHLPRRSAEEDLAQEVFMKVFSRLSQYRPRPGTPFEHWVSRLAVRTCLDGLRSERRRPELRWSDLSADAATWLQYLLAGRDEPPHTAAAAARETVAALLSRLSPADRLVLTLLDLEERPVKEISRLTGWSVTLVKVRAFRARQRLRKLGRGINSEECDV